MIAASLLLRSFWDLLNAPLGFNPQRVMTVRTRLPYPNDPKLDAYANVSREAQFLRELVRRSRTLPGVEEAAIGDLGAVPLGHDRDNQNPPDPLTMEDRDTPGQQAPLVDASIVTPEYFHLLGMSLSRGRLFSDFDDDKAPPVAVINEAMARTYWPNEDPVGKHIKLSRRDAAWTTVVGIVGDARAESLENARIPEVYTNLYQRGGHHLAIFLRGNLDAGAIPGEVREQVQMIDATLPVFGAQTLGDTVSASLAARKFSMEMVALFALTALLMAGMGIYGVISFVVAERGQEIGIRLALGAQRGNIMRMVLRQGLGLALAGTALGFAGAVVVSRLIAGLLYGVRPTDPLSFAVVAVLLLGVAFLACLIPARRAVRVNPLAALRHD
jgi:predicted permease